MKDYPVAVFVAAAKSVAGHLLMLMAALSVATWLGFFVLSGEFPWSEREGGWVFFLLGFLGPIVAACLQFWGILYIAVIAWLGYKLMFEDSPVQTALFVLLAQFLCTLIVLGFADGWRDGIAVRLLIVVPPLLLAGMLPKILNRIRRRNEATTT